MQNGRIQQQNQMVDKTNIQVKSKSTESCCGRMIQTMNPRKMTASKEPHIWQKSTPKAMHRKGSGSCFLQEFPKNNRLIQRMKVQ